MSKLDALEQRSKMLFNSAHMLDIARSIADGPEVFKAEHLQVGLGLAQSTVHRALRVLEELKLLTRRDRASRTQALEFERHPHSFWDAAQDLSEVEENA